MTRRSLMLTILIVALTTGVDAYRQRLPSPDRACPATARHTVDMKAFGGQLSLEYRRALESALRYFETAAPKHTADEEDSLFPRLRASGDPDAERALSLVEQLERDANPEAWGAHSDRGAPPGHARLQCS